MRKGCNATWSCWDVTGIKPNADEKLTNEKPVILLNLARILKIYKELTLPKSLEYKKESVAFSSMKH